MALLLLPERAPRLPARRHEQSSAAHESPHAQALREVEREKARQKLADADRQDLTYLKNILLKLFETGACLAGRSTACLLQPAAEPGPRRPGGSSSSTGWPARARARTTLLVA